MSEALEEAFEYVLPDDQEEMSEEEKAVYLAENVGTLKEYLRERGYDVSKSDEGSPREMLKTFYGADTGTTSYFDPETVDAVESKFAEPDDIEPDGSNPSLSVHYGKSVDTPASSNLGDTAHNSGNQADE
jgi:peptidoglycan hydrolase-like protein with peptidoglycan-binding domain